MKFYFGIDVASEKHNCCIMDSKEQVVYEFEFSNTQAGFERLLSALNNSAYPDDCQKIIGLEATGIYSENLTNFLRRNGFEVTTLNPLSVKKQLSATTLRKTKTDRSDARFLALLMARENYKPDVPPLYHINELKSISRARFSTVKKRSAAKTQAKGFITKLFPEYLKVFSDTFGATSIAVLFKYPSAKDIAAAHVQTLAKLLNSSSRGRFGTDTARELIELAKRSVGTYSRATAYALICVLEEIELFNRQINRFETEIDLILNEHPTPIQTIPGIGNVTAAMIISEIGDISRFSTPSKLLAFAGLDPSVYQSGKFTPASGSMVKRGSTYLRYALMLASRIVPRYSSVFGNYLNKKIGEGKHFNVATSHVAKKLVRIIFSLQKNNVAFSDFC